MNSRNLKRNFLGMMMSGALMVGFSQQAKALTDEDAADMLSAKMEENADGVVRWGQPHHQKVRAKIDPISESSFRSANENGDRSPASAAPVTATAGPKEAVNTVVTFGTRSPASANEEGVDRKLAAKTVVRNLAQKKAYQEVAVIVNDLGFFPSTIFVTQGIPVRLYVTGASKKSQCIMMDSYGIRRQVQSQKVEEITFTPDETGSFAFSCPMNGAKGTILVKELELDRIPASVVISQRKKMEEEEKRAREEAEDEEARSNQLH